MHEPPFFILAAVVASDKLGRYFGVESSRTASISADTAIDEEQPRPDVLFYLHRQAWFLGLAGVYRAKGMVWISERRQSRAVMHFHGLHRFELH
eukprot:scaffold141206_cov31-Prasinocladus_malaysianus.AAC.1